MSIAPSAVMLSLCQAEIPGVRRVACLEAADVINQPFIVWADSLSQVRALSQLPSEQPLGLVVVFSDHCAVLASGLSYYVVEDKLDQPTSKGALQIILRSLQLQDENLLTQRKLKEELEQKNEAVRRQSAELQELRDRLLQTTKNEQSLHTQAAQLVNLSGNSVTLHDSSDYRVLEGNQNAFRLFVLAEPGTVVYSYEDQEQAEGVRTVEIPVTRGRFDCIEPRWYKKSGPGFVFMSLLQKHIEATGRQASEKPQSFRWQLIATIDHQKVVRHFLSTYLSALSKIVMFTNDVTGDTNDNNLQFYKAMGDVYNYFTDLINNAAMELMNVAINLKDESRNLLAKHECPVGNEFTEIWQDIEEKLNDWKCHWAITCQVAGRKVPSGTLLEPSVLININESVELVSQQVLNKYGLSYQKIEQQKNGDYSLLIGNEHDVRCSFHFDSMVPLSKNYLPLFYTSFDSIFSNAVDCFFDGSDDRIVLLPFKSRRAAVSSSPRNERKKEVRTTVSHNYYPTIPGLVEGLSCEPGYYVVVEVSDSGPGIDTGCLSKIFTPCHTTKSRSMHSGMGLAALSSAIKLLQGGVAFDTSASGTTFRLYLPLEELKKK